MRTINDAVPLRRIDDQTLIQRFAQGESDLLANQNLRIESAFQGIQLIARREGVIAALKTVDGRLVPCVRQGCSWQSIIHDTFVRQSFVPIDKADPKGFIDYEKRDVPAGFRLHSAEARLLWKEWWLLHRRRSNRQSLQSDLMIWIRKQWYPIRDLQPSHSIICIKTLVEEIKVETTSMITWLSRIDAQSAVAPSMAAKIAQKLSSAPVGRSFSGSDSQALADTSTSQPLSPSPEVRPAAVVNQAVPRRSALSPTQPPQAPPPMLPVSTERAIDEWTIAGVPETYTQNQRNASEKTVYLGTSQQEDCVIASPTTAQSVVPQPDLTSIARLSNGRLYITTALGEVVVEGTQLKFWLNA